ncbi:MAG: carbamoyl phosphate synthase small subunit, partial [Planctomycetes bacterium]|nr:carbamoyl phosphate synthase small subunit [Planctomycetota bacterium]
HKSLPAFSVQYHPEASGGPHDSKYLFAEFLRLLAGRGAAVGT